MLESFESGPPKKTTEAEMFLHKIKCQIDTILITIGIDSLKACNIEIKIIFSTNV